MSDNKKSKTTVENSGLCKMKHLQVCLFLVLGFSLSSQVLARSGVVHVKGEPVTSAGAGESVSTVAWSNSDKGGTCGNRIRIKTISGSCQLTEVISGKGGCLNGGSGDKTLTFSMLSGVLAEVKRCHIEYRADCTSCSDGWDHRYVKVKQNMNWISYPTTSQPIGYGSQAVMAKTVTTDNANDIATTDNTLLKFTSDTPSICNVKEWGAVEGLESGVCVVRATVDTTDDFNTITETKSWSYHWPDTDNDGVLDKTDNCRDTANPLQEDTDENGIGDACNDSRDPDGDEYEYGYDNCAIVGNPDQKDTDGSGIGDACNDHLDPDDDEYENSHDNCRNTPNPGQENTFGSPELGDACEVDNDSDGVLDGVDNCPTVANPGQEDSDNDGVGNACAADSDSDGVDNQLDNCVAVYNPNQLDSNSNGVGDVCEPDSDGDGIKDDNGAQIDNCPLISNPDQADVNNNGIGDACEMAFVKPSSTGTADCLSWANACSSIQTAITTAANTGRSQVFMAKGLYPLASTVNLQAGINIVGGFVGVPSETRSTQANPLLNITVISGDAAGNDPKTNNLVMQVSDRVGDNTSRLLSANGQGLSSQEKISISGITLNAAGGSSLLSGSALFVYGSNVELINSRVLANQTNNGAVHAAGGAKLVIRSSVLESNKSTGNASALFINNDNTYVRLILSKVQGNIAGNTGAVLLTGKSELIVDETLFEGNSAGTGGALATYTSGGTLTVNNSRFIDNEATKGGAVALLITQKATIKASEFKNNYASQYGGAVSVAQTSGAVTVDLLGNLFATNKAGLGGAAIYATGTATQLNVDNNTLAFNKSGVDKAGVVNASSSRGGAIYIDSTATLPISLKHNTLVANEAHGTGYGGGAIAVNRNVTAKTTLFANVIAGNYAASANGANVLEAAAGTQNGQAKFIDAGYNLIGFNNESGMLPANIVNIGSTSSFVATEATLEEIIEVNLSSKGGDGYFSKTDMLPIVGGGPARDLIPEANCVLASDARGEARPDVKNQMCDIGAYEFTILSCAEDAQRRYDQGELFVKSCTPELEDFELTLGSASYWLLAMLGLLGFTRRQYLKNK